MHFTIRLASHFLAVAALACSSESHPEAAHADGTHDTGMIAADSAVVAQPDSGTTPSDAGSASMPITPTLLSAVPMGGGLHVTWRLNDTGLNGVELWRNKDAGAYGKLVSLPGSAKAYHDASASGGSSTYCFKVKTLKGDMASELSNEVCGKP